MAPKKLAVTSKALQVLLTRIGSASSGTKSTLLARFQRDIQRPGFCYRQPNPKNGRSSSKNAKLRIMSIDMGIRNLAFCDAEVSHVSGNGQGFDAHMSVLRWKKLDLVSKTDLKSTRVLMGDDSAVEVVDDEGDQFSPSVLSRTAYHLIVKEVLSVNPDVVLIEKQRWRSGGGSAVQQWTLRVNTLEAMLWAILETLKQRGQSHDSHGAPVSANQYQVFAVDPKRVGQYWLGQHARALQERHEDAQSSDVAALSKESDTDDTEEDATDKTTKKPSRSKAEKSAKIAILRSWLADDAMSSTPSTPSSMPRIAFNIAPTAEATRQALLPKNKTIRQKKTSKLDAGLVTDIPATDIKKLDDITDCFLQAAAWVAWESNRLQLLMESGGNKVKDRAVVDEARVLEMIKQCEED